VTQLLVVGAGLIGHRHAQRIAAHPRCHLAAIVDPNPKAANGLDVPRFADIAAVDLPIDAAIIATPTPLHATHAQEAAARGWPLLIEKPVAATQAEAQSIATLNTPILIGHHRRHHPRVQALKALLDAGEIGAIITATLIWAMRKPDSYFEDNWRSTDGSPVMINLVHDLDLLAYWFGRITQIAALPGMTRRSTGQIDSGALALGLANGATATVSFADTAPSPWGFEAGTGENPNIGTTGQDMAWITGTKGGISFPSLTIWHGQDWSAPAQAQPPRRVAQTAPLDAQLDHFLEVVAGRTQPLCSVADGRAALHAALEIERQLLNH